MIAASHILTPDTRPIDWRQPVNWSDPLNDGLVSWWMAVPNYTAGGSTWRDLCGLNDGTLTNFASVDQAWKTQGQPGGFGALEFDGTNDYATVSVASSLEPPQMTVTAWIRYVHDDNDYFADIVGSSHGGIDALGWVFEKGGNYLNALCSFSDSFETINVLGSGFSSQTVGDGEWHQLAIVASSDLFSAYTDATLGGTRSVTGGVTHSDRDVIFGKWWRGGRYYLGDISDVRIWDRALTASEIQTYYDVSCRHYPGLINRPSRRSVFAPSTGTTITPATLSISAALQGSPPVSSRTIEVT